MRSTISVEALTAFTMWTQNPILGTETLIVNLREYDLYSDTQIFDPNIGLVRTKEN